VFFELIVNYERARNSYLFNEFVCKLGFFLHEWATSAKKIQFTQERVEYNVFLFDETLKGSKSLKIFKISLTFRFDKLSNFSKSVHTGENSQILTVSNKKFFYLFYFYKVRRENSLHTFEALYQGNVTLTFRNFYYFFNRVYPAGCKT
jgi:hypothetical protein